MGLVIKYWVDMGDELRVAEDKSGFDSRVLLSLLAEGPTRVGGRV